MRYKYSDDLLREAVEKSKTYAEVLRYIGAYGSSGSAHSHIKGRITKLGIDTSHFLGPTEYNRRLTKAPDVLILSSDEEISADPRTVVRALMKTGVLKICLECGNNGSWRGAPLRLHLDHVNGNRRDNRTENLRFLCPNCHDQTETWGRK